MSFWTWLENVFGGAPKPAPAPVPAPVKPTPAPVPVPVVVSPPPAPLPSNTRLNCFDVSHYEPNVDWKQAVASGMRVCMSKWTDGGASVDPTGAADRAASKAHGLAYMPFHFFRFGPDAAAQAEHMVKTTGGVQVGELPHCMDLEWDNSSGIAKYANGGQLDEEGAQKALVFLEKLEALTGVIPVVYTASSFFPGTATHETARKFARYILWVCSFHLDTPKVPFPWSGWTFWQYTDKKAVPGTGAIDASYFNGGEAELAKLLKA